jgi:hypothetical protein
MIKTAILRVRSLEFANARAAAQPTQAPHKKPKSPSFQTGRLPNSI